MINNIIKDFRLGGQDQDSAIPFIDQTDYIEAFNILINGSSEGEDGYVTNLPSNDLIAGNRATGINKCIGADKFETLRIIVGFIYNSAGLHQLVEYNYDTNVQTIIFTNITDSNGVDVLPLNPKYFVTDIKLVDDTFLLFRADNLPPGYINYNRLKSGYFGVLTVDDLSLAKPQNLVPATFVYSDDKSRSVNLLSQKLIQVISKFGFVDYEKSAWSTMSKRGVPSSEGTPTVGTDVTKNNNLIISVNIGDNRVSELNIGARYDMLDFFLIKTISRTQIITLIPTAIDINNQVYEAYNPATNIYSFVFYNDGLYPNIPVLETDLYFDAVPLLAGATELLNGNVVALADYKNGYVRPNTLVQVSAVAYDPGIAVVLPVYDYLRKTYVDGGGPGSGAGDHKRTMQVNFLGLPKQGDVINMTFTDIRDSTQNFTVSHTVIFAEQDNLLQTMLNYAAQIGTIFNTYSTGTGINAASDQPTSPQVIIRMIGPPYYQVTAVNIVLFNAGAGVSKSIHGFKSNSSYQAALSYYDNKGRFLPLRTDSSFVFKTQSYAQLLGMASSFQWRILTVPAPEGAVSYQWCFTKNNTHQTNLDIDGALVKYIGSWDAKGNTPTLAAGSGTVGDTYVINVPGPQNLGNGTVSFNAGDFIVYNGQTWDVSNKTFGDLSDTQNYLIFKINPLAAFNKKNSSSILIYDYSPGDRVTFNYFVNGGTNVYFNNPVIDVEVVDFDVSTYLLKVRKSVAIDNALNYNGVSLASKDVIFSIYTPLKRTTTEDGSTSNNEQLFYEVGEQYPIVNGQHSVLTGTITDGDIYYKTREVQSAINTNNLLELVVEDFNFSDFYKSNYTSYGRTRNYDDVLEVNTKIACICYSGEYIIGSKINNLTRFFPARVYGEADGQSSANFGSIDKMIQRNNELVIMQKLKIGYVPVFESIITDQAEQQNVAISDKILGNIRYNNSGNIGTGGWKKAIVPYNNNIYFLDPMRSEPIRAGLDGVKPISGKMSKFFKTALQQCFKNDLEPIGFYDPYNNQYIISIPTDNDTVTTFNFDAGTWQYQETFATPVPGNITILASPSNGTVAYNNVTGKAVYTPNTDYIGTDNFTFSFPVNGATVVKRTCINIAAGNTGVYPFSFTPKINQQLSTQVLSNSILVGGNTVPVHISITGGQYSINGGAFTSTAGNVNAGDTVQVRVLSSSTQGTNTNGILTIGGVSGTFVVTTGTTSVNPFVFPTKTGQPLSTSINSDFITVVGNSIAAPISITGGTYSKNGGAFVSTPDTVIAGDTVIVRVTSSGSYNTAVSCTLTIGTQTGTFTARTAHINAFVFAPQSNVNLSTLVVSNSITVSGAAVIAIPISITGGSYSINGGSYTSASGFVNLGDNVTVRLTSSSSYTTPVSCTLTILDQTGTFTATTSASTTVGVLQIDIFNDTSLNACAFIATPGATAVYNIPVYTGVNFNPNDGTPAGNCFALASDVITGGTLSWRYQINLAKVASMYPLLTTITVKVSGRDVSPGILNGAYSLKSASDAVINMSGTPGTYVPSVTGTSLGAPINYSGKATVGGANGTYGIGVGADILVFTYDVASNTVTLA